MKQKRESHEKTNTKNNVCLSKLIKSCYNYFKNHKFFFFLIIALCAGSIYSVISYVNYTDSIKKKEQAEIENKYVIKRSFCGLSLGDSTEEAINNIPSPNPRKFTYSGNVISKVSVGDVYMGDRLINNMVLYFHKDKLFKLVMYINISINDYNNNYTYNHFLNLFEKNGYKHDNHNYDLRRDFYYDKIMDSNDLLKNLSCFSDKHTDLELFNSSLNINQPQVILTYYDKDSHYFDDIKKANEILDTAFVQIFTNKESLLL